MIIKFDVPEIGWSFIQTTIEYSSRLYRNSLLNSNPAKLAMLISTIIVSLVKTKGASWRGEGYTEDYMIKGMSEQ